MNLLRATIFERADGNAFGYCSKAGDSRAAYCHRENADSLRMKSDQSRTTNSSTRSFAFSLAAW